MCVCVCLCVCVCVCVLGERDNFTKHYPVKFGDLSVYTWKEFATPHSLLPELAAVCSLQDLHQEASPPKLQQQMHEHSHCENLNRAAVGQPTRK